MHWLLPHLLNGRVGGLVDGVEHARPSASRQGGRSPPWSGAAGARAACSPINSIASIVDDPSYIISPEYQRRHRWDEKRKSRLVESLIMKVPVPPIFLYESDYSKHEVMDGLQRLTAIHAFYRNKFALTELVEWSELNGRTDKERPSKVREGIDRHYRSSVSLFVAKKLSSMQNPDAATYYEKYGLDAN